MQIIQILLAFVVIFTLVNVSIAKKPKPQKPSKPEGSKGPADVCLWCLWRWGDHYCIPPCREGPPHSPECKECVLMKAPICLRACGFYWLADKMLADTNPGSSDSCILQSTALPLESATGISYVTSQFANIPTAEQCGLTCARNDNQHKGWTFANSLNPQTNTCFCLGVIDIPLADVTFASAPTLPCPTSNA